MTIAIVDYGMGNVRSLMNAFQFIGEDAIVTCDVGELEDADRLVLPGVGAFGDAMAAIRATGLQEPLTRLAMEEKKPVLGVCLGMQLFAKSSREHGNHEGLSWLDAEVVPLEVEAPAKVPHVGWNGLSFDSDDWLFEDIPAKQTDFYFVHSFHMVCRDPADVVATSDHGGQITAVVRRDNLVAAQFHPEKSQDNGLQMLQNWMAHDFAC
ncbi:MAG TPA: imidazole glycerol phosphate synthase subunit HisH [Allosphingosinicella sp.]|uniref:imidazole glycerol phosphate synthase subunit HisH n=1 Tax=Allosphingosinicella sp. TaxID=2823234 RepID=UPI002ED881A3